MQLFYLVSGGLEPAQLDELMRLANEPDGVSDFRLPTVLLQGFPLCVVGINFSFLILNRLRKGGFDRWVAGCAGTAYRLFCRVSGQLIRFLNLLYRACFLEFRHFWTEAEGRTIAQFGELSGRLKRELKRPHLLLARHSAGAERELAC